MRDPYLLLPTDFRNDLRIRSLTPEQRWVFCCLLIYANERGRRGIIRCHSDHVLAIEVADGDMDLLNETIKNLVELRFARVLNDTDPRKIQVVYSKEGFQRPPVAEWQVLRSTVFERDGYTCVYCGARDVELHCDHVMPASRGGEHSLDNLVTACAKCNRSKHDRTPEEWLR